MKSYNIVALKYKEMLEEKGYTKKKSKNGSTEIGHLLWMLSEILKNNDQSETKKHRWLGFIQGCLIKDKILNIKEERNSTRDIFNGE